MADTAAIPEPPVPELSPRELAWMVQPVPPGSVVVLRGAHFDPDDDTVLVAELARASGHRQFVVVHLPADACMDVVHDPEAVANLLGLVRPDPPDPAGPVPPYAETPGPVPANRVGPDGRCATPGCWCQLPPGSFPAEVRYDRVVDASRRAVADGRCWMDDTPLALRPSADTAAWPGPWRSCPTCGRMFSLALDGRWLERMPLPAVLRGQASVFGECVLSTGEVVAPVDGLSHPDTVAVQVVHPGPQRSVWWPRHDGHVGSDQKVAFVADPA